MAGGGRGGGGRVQFDMAPSPALTPTWKSTSWNRSALGAKVGGGGGAGGSGGGDVERSPELKPGGDQHADDFDEQVSWLIGSWMFSWMVQHRIFPVKRCLKSMGEIMGEIRRCM